jgi:ABC-type Zn uptake system ZnuABC Zn-binding protein ZnuA
MKANLKFHFLTAFSMLASLGLAAAGCGATPERSQAGLRVLAAESFLADIAQQVAGEHLQVEALIPAGLDPHAFEPTPRDVARIAEAQVFIVNGGLEEWLAETLANLDSGSGDAGGGRRLILTASDGLVPRQPAEGEPEIDEPGGDPHFWLDPTLVIRYVENIRQALSQFDPAGASAYETNASAYIQQLQELDGWIRQQIDTIPPERRVLVTNHESFGYYADRYGLKVIGTLLPSASSGAAPSAQQLAELVERIRASRAPAIFLETGTNPQLAEQIAQETGARVVSGLYSHSISASDGPAPTYIAMLRYNTQAIVEALR